MKVTLANGNAPLTTILHPEIEIEKSETDTIGGRTVARIRVNNHEGLGADFIVSIAFKRGRPVATLSTDHGDGSVVKKVRKEVTGTCRKL